MQVGQSGSHPKWRNPATAKQVIVAHHRGHVLPPGTMKAMIEGSGIASAEWLE
jgi:predicted RNA binding protein YcfA (HicA-like mRNA interferase family)